MSGEVKGMFEIAPDTYVSQAINLENKTLWILYNFNDINNPTELKDDQAIHLLKSAGYEIKCVKSSNKITSYVVGDKKELL